MTDTITFHFEGALADDHRMNFYEAARFQYAAARLMVKLAQFRQTGKFVKKITNKSNSNIQLISQSDGSFNINVEDPPQSASDKPFIDISISDLIAYVSERIVEKIDDEDLSEPLNLSGSMLTSKRDDTAVTLDNLVESTMSEGQIPSTLSEPLQDLLKRRIAETHRERRLTQSQHAISKIDFARSQKLIAMSAPLLSEMATALRRSANTLEITSSENDLTQSVLFLDQDMAREIETAVVDQEITPILGDITQFNKDNGWGKIKIENGAKTVSFSIPFDILHTMKQKIIDNMKKDLVYLQTYFVRDRSNEPIRLIAVGILPTPLV